MRRTCLALLSAAISAALFAGPAHADRLDDALRAEMKRRHVPGLSVLVLKDGKVIILANADSTRPSRFADLVAAHSVPDLFDAPAKAIPDPDTASATTTRRCWYRSCSTRAGGSAP